MVTIPLVINPPIVVESKLDMGQWLDDVKISVYATDILQIPGQKENLMKALESSHNIVNETAPPSNNDILEDFPVVLEDMPIVLHSVDPKREDHPPFYVSLLVDDLLLHICILDSSASSNVITRKVMEQLNLRITRPYHNVCAMDAREVEVVGIILNLHVKLTNYPDINMAMDVVVIDVPDNWVMLLSRNLGCNSRWTHPNGLEIRNHPCIIKH